MKLLLTFLTLGVLIAISGPLGCKRNDDASGGSSALAIDLTKVEKAFASATGAIKSEWDKIVSAIKSQDYSGAWTSLQTFASNAKLSEEQKAALSELMAQIKAKAGDALKSASDAAAKAVDKAKEAVGNTPPK